MTILALEFSSERRSVAVLRDGVILAEAVHHGTRETPIFALITQALSEADVSRDAIEVLAVGLGPGSYTGIRLAISVAQGWQLANGVKTMGINSLENLARVVSEWGLASDGSRDGTNVPGAFSSPAGESHSADGERGNQDHAISPVRLLLAVDAQRDELAVAPAQAGRLIGPVRLVSAAELRTRLAQGEVVAGPEVVQLLGGGQAFYPSAAVAARLAATVTEFPAAETLVPVYLRETNFVKAPTPRVV